MKDIVLSGIRATGQLHLGNYFGALRNFVKMQEEGTYDANYFIADLCFSCSSAIQTETFWTSSAFNNISLKSFSIIDI